MTQPGTGRRPGGSGPLHLLVAMALATVAGLFIAATTQVGPVLLAVTPHHGIHLGDLAAFAVFYCAAIVGVLVLRRTALLVGYALATLVALALAAGTRIGPVLWTIPPSLRIQLGDVLGFVACYAAVLVAGLLWSRRRNPSPTRAPDPAGVARSALPRR
jgi:hypothetical protein